MKKKFLVIALTLFSILPFVAFFTGCKEHKHTYGVWEAYAQATCTSPAQQKRTCTKCGEEEIQEVGIGLGHTESAWLIDCDSTCTIDGSQHKECTVCGKVLATAIVDKKPHTMTEWKETSPATCTAAQQLERHCTTCSTQNETKAGNPATGHTESAWIVDSESTCVTVGSQHKECTVCKTKLSTQVVAKKQHNITAWAEASPATCTAPQQLERHCTTCTTKNETKAGNPATGHTESTWIVEIASTCTAYGTSYKKCTVCQKELARDSYVAKLNHTESAWIVDIDSTCTKTGSEHKECTICKTKLSTQVIAKKQHSMTNWTETSPATCTEAQQLERHCATCSTQNETKAGNPATGHTESTWIVEIASTCTAYGTSYKKCMVCNLELQRDTQVAKLNHTESDWKIDKDSTCVATGSQHKECTICGTTLETGTIEKKQHIMTNWVEVSPATCTTAQQLERHCSTCLTQNETKAGDPATGHTPSDWKIDVDSTCIADGSKHKECTVCEAVLETGTIAKKQHTITNWAEASPATCTAPQQLERHCTTCTTKNETKAGNPATGHTWVDVTCDIEGNYYVTTQTCKCGATNKVKEEYKTVYFDIENCSINNLDNTKVIIGKKVSLNPVADDGYIIEKLVYVLGSYSGETFTEIGEEIYIYNNSFIMPDSDVLVKCYCVRKIQKATIRNNQITLTSSAWMPDNMTLDIFNLYLTDGNSTQHTLINGKNLGKNMQTCNELFNVELDEIPLNYNSTLGCNTIGVSFGVFITFTNTDTYRLHSGECSAGRSFNTVQILNNGILTVEDSCEIQLFNTLTNSVEKVQMVFEVTIQLNIKDQHRVTYISNDSEVENVTVFTGDTISSIPEGEWYTDENFSNKWDFALDKVTADITLYKKEQ